MINSNICFEFANLGEVDFELTKAITNFGRKLKNVSENVSLFFLTKLIAYAFCVCDIWTLPVARRQKAAATSISLSTKSSSKNKMIEQIPVEVLTKVLEFSTLPERLNVATRQPCADASCHCGMLDTLGSYRLFSTQQKAQHS
jgi:hypothetical protein